MKKTLLILAALLCCCFALKAQENYDFADNSTGQTIYYRITDANTVSIVAPHSDISGPWDGFTKPVGEITLPETVTHDETSYTVTGIGNYAFLSCNELTGQLVIPDGVTSIGVSAFYGCSGFTGSLTIPNSVKTIEQQAFESCEGLSGKLIIGSSVEKIRHWAFANTGFSYVGIKATTPPTFGNEPFQGIPNTLVQAIAVPEGCADAYKTALSEYADKITGVVLQDHCLFLSSSNEDMGSASMTSHEGSHVTITAAPKNNSWFVNWTENGGYVSSESTISFDLTADRFLVANFGRNYDFTDNSTGQTLYYRIIDAEHRSVRLVAPNGDNSNGWNDITKPTGEITLSETVRHNNTTYTVTEIGDYAFYKCEGLTGSPTIPNSVTEIGDWAFYNCIRFNGTLTIGNSVKSIGDDAFRRCSGFTGSLTIPNFVTSIGTYAFENCSGFNGTLTIGTSVDYIGYYAFGNCSHFTGSLTIPNSVKSIDTGAFYQCSGFTGSLVIPNSVTSIGGYAFYYCSGLNGKLTIGNSVTIIGNRAFEGCSKLFEVINLSSLNIVKGSTDNGYAAYYALSVITDPSDSKLEESGDFVFIIADEANYLVSYKGNSTQLTLPESFHDENYVIYKNAFKYCTGFTGSLIIPNSVTSIGDYAFYYCSGFNGQLIIGDAVTSIGDYAFYKCSGFNGQLTLGDAVTSIGKGAFENCLGFTGSLTIPNSVESIGEQAFNGCYNLIGTLTIGYSVESIADEAFYGCRKLMEVINFSELDIVKGATTHGHAAYYAIIVKNSGSAGEMVNYGDFVFYISGGNNYLVDYKGNATQLILPDSYEGQNYAIGNYAFSGRKNFTGSLIIPESVTGIGDRAFTGCSGFTGSLIIPESVISIGNGVFEDCTGFTGSLTIPNSVTSIGYAAFEDCHGLNGSLTIGNSVTSIGEYAFYRCFGLTGTLTIGSSVKSIGEQAFEECIRLAEVINYSSLNIEKGSEDYGEAAYYALEVKTSGPSELVNYGDFVFFPLEGTNYLIGYTGSSTQLTLPASYNGENYVISHGAFYYRGDLMGTLTIPETVTSIGELAFYYCDGFTGPLTIPNSVKSIEYAAFMWCPGLCGSLTIGSSMKSIGQDAFWNCDFTNIISKAEDAPSLSSHISNNTNIVYVPSGTIASYETAWYGHDYTFIEYDGGSYHFNGTTDNNWSTPTNWEENQVPAQNSPLVFINADCQVNTNAEVGVVNVAADKTLTVNQNCTLTADGIILEEGAQLIDNGSMECSNYTIMKNIAGYGTGTGNWYLISSPVDKNDFYWIHGVLTYPEDTYDLYRFEQAGDEEGNEWINRKYVEEVYDVEFGLENQRGYLYANKNGTTILFRGGLAATEAKKLEYVEGVDFPGFNLIGNPYPCNTRIGRSFYRMNTAGTELIADVADAEIAPCEGVFVQAQGTGESVTFTPSATPATRSLPAATVALTLSQSRSAAAIDRAIVRLGEGDVLGKMMLNANGTRLYIPQNGKDYAVVSTDASRGEMPLNFKAAKDGSYTITMNVENADLNYLHLVDNLTGNDVDLMAAAASTGSASYTFDAKTDDYASRFKLVFDVNGDAASTGSAGNFAYISNGEIIVSNEGRATLQVIDVMGRIVSSEEINGDCRISTNGLTAGVYVLSLNGKTQKIVVK